MHALPLASCGLELDIAAIRVAVGLRLGVNLCESHQRPYGKQFDARGTRRPFIQARRNTASPAIALCRLPTHLRYSNHPSCLEATAGGRTDRRSSPGKGAKYVTWHVTVTEHHRRFLSMPLGIGRIGRAAEGAASRKEVMYAVETNQSHRHTIPSRARPTSQND